MRFEVLGPLRVNVDGATLALGSPQQQRVLALLLASPNRPVSIERLIDEMWREAPPSARHLVQDYVWRLRRLFADAGGRIDRDASGYTIRVEPGELDSEQLAAAVDRAQGLGGGNAAAAERILREATGKWRGRPFGTLGDESSVLQLEAQRLEELYLSAMADCIEAGLVLGRHRDLVGELEKLTERYPYREQFWELLMLALYRSGRQAEALRAYQGLRRILGEDLGIEPAPAVRELEGRILLHDADLLWEPPPPPCNVPIRLTSFVGRSDEILAVVKLLHGYRLVTLTGPGGIGKTRLAAEAAEQVLLDHPDGVWWVDLAAVTDSDLVTEEAAHVLGVVAQPGIPIAESLVGALVRRHALLVLDNCEHVAGGVARLVNGILAGTQGVGTLVTSRVPLRVHGERLWSVPPLRVPPAGGSTSDDARLADAIRLFAERATAADRTFALEDDLPGVVEVCRRLDGIPLAIEMASARVRVLTPSQLATSLDDRFTVLPGADGSGDPRHATLEAVLDWSYRLLDPEVRGVFDRLSIFAESFDLEAADAVACTDTAALPALDAITALVDASMVATTGGIAGLRYRLLDTLRAYGTRHLAARAEETPVRRAHAGYFFGLVEQAGEAIGSTDFGPWVARLHEVYPDLQQALAWSVNHQPADALRAARTLFHYWFRTGGAAEAGRWGTRMLERAGRADISGMAAAHLAMVFAEDVLGSEQEAMAHAEAAIDLSRQCGDLECLGVAIFGKGSVALRLGDFCTMTRCANQALVLCDETGDRWVRAGSLSNLSFAEFLGGGSLDEARRLAEEAMALYRELGDIASQIVFNPLSVIALKQGDLDAAERFAIDTATLAAGSGWEATALVSLAEVSLARGDVEGAGTILRRAAVLALDTGLENWFRISLLYLARVAYLEQSPLLAARLLGAARRMTQQGKGTDVDHLVETDCRRALDEVTFKKATDGGFRMSHREILALLEGWRHEGPPVR